MFRLALSSVCCLSVTLRACRQSNLLCYKKPAWARDLDMFCPAAAAAQLKAADESSDKLCVTGVTCRHDCVAAASSISCLAALRHHWDTGKAAQDAE